MGAYENTVVEEGAREELAQEFLKAREHIKRLENERLRGWQRIETAPKDGTPVLAFMPDYHQGKGGVHVVVWMDWSDRPGWYSHVSSIHDPTLWMPIPWPEGCQ